MRFILSTAIFFGIGSIINMIFGNGWPLWIFCIIGGIVWFSVNEGLIRKIEGN